MTWSTKGIGDAARELERKRRRGLDDLAEDIATAYNRVTPVKAIREQLERALEPLLQAAEAVEGCAMKMNALSESVGTCELNRLRKELRRLKLGADR